MDVKDRDDVLETLARAEAALDEARSDFARASASIAEALDREEAVGRGETSGDEEAALTAFLQTLRALLGDRPLTVESAHRAALLAAAGQVGERELGPLLASSDVRTLLGDVSRQRVDELLRALRLIGLRDRAGRRRSPAFQFVAGRPLEPLVAAFWTIAGAAADEWTAASWCVAPDEALDGRSPAQWARDGEDPARLGRVAEQDAARLAQ